MIKGFEPIVSSDPKILILGSMPSVKSLEKQEYYGFKQNRFWQIISAYFNVTFTTYEDKKNCIKDNHLALWDVINTCEREGSLDSAIHDETINDIRSLVKDTNIQLIICNGKKSYTLYNKYFKDILIECIYLPSTSGANQTIKKDALFQLWFDAFNKIL